MTTEEIQAEVAKRHWFHSIDLGNGIVTPGHGRAHYWQDYQLPERLDGKTVLDIGAWDGFFSFEAEKRGAARVVAMDVWDRPENVGSLGSGRDNLDFVKQVLGSKIEPLNCDIYQIGIPGSPIIGQFDVVLFLQVLYHLQHPMLGLTNLRLLTAPEGVAYLETWIDAEWVQEPAMIFYPDSELANDPTNWWGPNIKCVEAMAKAAGFKECTCVWWRQDCYFDGRGKRACFHLK